MTHQNPIEEVRPLTWSQAAALESFQRCFARYGTKEVNHNSGNSEAEKCFLKSVC